MNHPPSTLRRRQPRTCAAGAAAGLFLTAALIGLPLLGVWLAGAPVARYLEFPPLTRYVRHAPFSWPMFAGLAALILLVILPFDIRVLLSRRRVKPAPARRAFPWWGWLGLAWGVTAWVLAWTRFSWLRGWQMHTFTPIWLGYIVAVNALTWRRTGRCMMLDRPAAFLALFPFSAAFWWFFEYLNRFVQNWYYAGFGPLTPMRYFLLATLPFSTVLPAVLGTYECFRSNPRMGAGLDAFLKIPVSRPRLLAWLGLAVSCAGLAGIGVWPGLLFPLLWLAPGVIIVCVQTIRGRATILSGIPNGRWRGLYLLALAALTCGLFWEMWNHFSLAKWAYTVPFVERFKLFEMPLLGYAGYLPFGLECAIIGEWVLGRDASRCAAGPP
ncbi:MAG: hypothetical protein JXR37_31950 [Kiritimatiellae bacterium]|nr:hypothetical protein [Kiritimatiellia bacterium]